MYNFDYTAHQQLAGRPPDSVQLAVRQAHEKAAIHGNFKVCTTTAGETLVLSDFSVLMRDDIVRILYDTDRGYTWNPTGEEKKQWN